MIAVPVFSCPFNLDQTLESSCYYLTHLPVLFTRNWGYIVSFLVTLFLFVILGGRILCGFMCPLGFVQDLAAICKKEKIDVILAAGGGSTIDCTKGIAAAALTEKEILS